MDRGHRTLQNGIRTFYGMGLRLFIGGFKKGKETKLLKGKSGPEDSL